MLRANWNDITNQVLCLYCPNCTYRVNFEALRAARRNMLAARRLNAPKVTGPDPKHFDPIPNPWPRTAAETAPRKATP